MMNCSFFVAVQECDARMLKRIQNAGTKKITILISTMLKADILFRQKNLKQQELKQRSFTKTVTTLAAWVI
jgi:carbamoylphosphate synthase small subunit